MKQLILSALFWIFLTLFLSNSISIRAQENCAAQNVPQGTPLVAEKYTGTSGGTTLWGYVLGHNIYFDFGFGERYDLNCFGQLTGIQVHFQGTSTSTTKTVDFSIFSIDPLSNLPLNYLGGTAVTHDMIDMNGNATIINFPSPITVPTSFFVAAFFEDYAHDNTTLGLDTLSIMHSPNGSRPASDLGVLYRNWVLQHGRGAGYKDVYNNIGLAIHLALYPIMDYDQSCESIYVDECGVCDGPGIPTGVCDCSGTLPTEWFIDTDGDGLGEEGTSIVDCDPPPGYVDNDDDDCAGEIDECGVCNGPGIPSNICDCEGTLPQTWYHDADGDGLGDPDDSTISCDEPNDHVTNDDDDDDTCSEPLDECGLCGGPGIPEGFCDCNGTPATLWFLDLDGDGLGDPNASILSCTPPDGYVDNDDDENDGCNGIVDECGICNGDGIPQGACDCAGTQPTTWFQDADADGLGDPDTSTSSCEPPPGFVGNSDDDNDTCAGQLDECGVCNGNGIEEGTCDCDGTLPQLWFFDSDGDGLGNPNVSLESCNQPPNYVSNGDDDDDGCTGMIDECGVCDGPGIPDEFCDCEGTAPAIWYADVDGDGLGDPANSITSCDQPSGYVGNSDDDNDGCQGIIDECGVCDGPGIEEGTCDCDGTMPQLWFADQDNDGLGDPNNSTEACDQPLGYVTNSDDDNDTCLGDVDECGVCNGQGIPEGFCDCEGTTVTIWYADVDGDGLGDPANSTTSCDQPSGYVSNADDDNDSCQGIIDECGVCNGNGIIEGTCDCDGNLPQLWFLDADGDGLGNPDVSLESCTQPVGYVTNSDDNNDECTGIVDECGICDGSGIQQGTCDCEGNLPQLWFFDSDGDGLGDANISLQDCERPLGYVANSDDDDDNCAQTVDECGICGGEGIPEGVCNCEGDLPTLWYRDFDGDELGDPLNTRMACSQPEGYIAIAGDFDDLFPIGDYVTHFRIMSTATGANENEYIFQIHSGHKNPVVIQLYEITGRILQRYEVMLENGVQQFVLNIDELPPAMYIFNIENRGVRETRKIVKTNR